MRSIFRPFKNKKEKDRRYYLVHYIFKEKIAVPLFKLAHRFLQKFFIKGAEDIPDRPENKHMKLLYEVLDEAFFVWFKKWQIPVVNSGRKQNNLPPIDEKEMFESWRNSTNAHWRIIPELCLKAVGTIYIEDTAYRAFIDVFSHLYYEKLSQLYEKDINSNFPLYINKFDGDPAYFWYWDNIDFGRDVSLLDITYSGLGDMNG